MGSLYDTLRWRAAAAQARERDSDRCTVQRLLGGSCSRRRFHVHHVQPVEDGGALYDLDNLATVCESHHPVWESLRRSILRSREPRSERPPTCGHRHPTREARELCEARLRRRWERTRPATV